MHMPQLEKPPWVRTLFDTWEERHAFIIGFGEGFNYLPASFKINKSVKKSLAAEYHYYMAGRACGFAIHLFVLACLVKFCVR